MHQRLPNLKVVRTQQSQVVLQNLLDQIYRLKRERLTLLLVSAQTPPSDHLHRGGIMSTVRRMWLAPAGMRRMRETKVESTSTSTFPSFRLAGLLLHSTCLFKLTDLLEFSKHAFNNQAQGICSSTPHISLHTTPLLRLLPRFSDRGLQSKIRYFDDFVR